MCHDVVNVAAAAGNFIACLRGCICKYHLSLWMRDNFASRFCSQNPDVAGQRFIISQTNLHTTKFFTDALKERFPHFEIKDGEGGDDKKVIDNTAVSVLLNSILSSLGFTCNMTLPLKRHLLSAISASHSKPVKVASSHSANISATQMTKLCCISS